MKYKSIFLYFIFFILLVYTGINIYEHQHILKPQVLQGLPRTSISTGILDENGDPIKEMPSVIYGNSYSFCIRLNSRNDKSLYLIILEDYKQSKFSTDRNEEKKYIHTIDLQKDRETRIKVTITPTKKGTIIIEPMIIDIYDYPYDPATNMAYTAGRFMNMTALALKVISDE